MKIELSKGINYRDSELMTLELELENLTGYDILSVESDLRAAGISAPAWEYSREFLVSVAAKAAHLPVEVLKGASVGDFTKIVNEVLIFLAGGATGSATEKNSGA